MRKKIPSTESARTIASLMTKYHVRPNRLRGQHFLIDDDVYEEILLAAELRSTDIVVEVGPGLGTLTEKLAEHVEQVIGVEVDEKLSRILTHRFSLSEHIEIVNDDILSTGVDELTQAPYKVVANVPYYLTGALFRKFLAEDRQPESMTVLIQREVAERIIAEAGEYTLAALGVQLYGTPTIIRIVSPESFHPAPQVESAILRITSIHPFPFSDVDEKMYWRVARVGFSSPRKMLKNNIEAGFKQLSSKDIETIFVGAHLSAKMRAQNLTREDWHALTREISLREAEK